MRYEKVSSVHLGRIQMFNDGNTTRLAPQMSVNVDKQREKLKQSARLPIVGTKKSDAVQIDNRYLDNLVHQYDRSTFLLKDIKEVNAPCK